MEALHRDVSSLLEPLVFDSTQKVIDQDGNLTTKHHGCPSRVHDPTRRNIHNKATGETITWLKCGYETGGEYTLARVTCGPDGGPPPHWHGSYTEQFTCISGTLQVLKEEAMMELKPGEDVLVVPGTIHRFSNDLATNGGKMVEVEVRVIPAKPGLEKGSHVLYGLCNEGLCDAAGVPSNMVHAALFNSAAFSDTHFIGFTGALLNFVAVGWRRTEDTWMWTKSC